MTQKAIGPSFYDELVAHGGLIGEHFSWCGDGTLVFFDDTPAEVVAGVEAVYAAHNPAAKSAGQVRDARDALIVECDWLVARHRDQVEASKPTTLTSAQYQAWLTYRQALRDLPAQSGFPASVTWPVAPV